MSSLAKYSLGTKNVHASCLIFLKTRILISAGTHNLSGSQKKQKNMMTLIGAKHNLLPSLPGFKEIVPDYLLQLFWELCQVIKLNQ